MSITTRLRGKDSIVLDWSTGKAAVSLETYVKSKTCTGYNSDDSAYFHVEVIILQEIVDSYHELMKTKDGIMDALNVVNGNLRDISRKERQVRGQLARMKLTDDGMEDILNAPELRALIDDSVVAG